MLLERVTDLVLNGKNLEEQKSILQKKEIWSNLDPEKALKWSRLAQIVGQIELALTVLNHINETAPDYMQAWKEHFELLTQLERKEEALQVRARALQINPQIKEALDTMLKSDQEKETDISENIDTPFVQLKRQEELLQIYHVLFQGREDCFARQWVDKKENKQGYVPVRRPITLQDIQEHLQGLRTYGIYLLKNDNRVAVGVLDVDLKKEFLKTQVLKEKEDLLRREKNYILEMVPEIGRKINLECLCEFSGRKGYHFWYFFDPPCEAAQVRKVLYRIASQIKQDISCFNLEVYPKQDRLSGKGLGNLVKLPLGVHRLTGKSSFFLPYKSKDVWEELKKLEEVKKNNLEQVQKEQLSQNSNEVLLHPRHKQWIQAYPELAILQERCPALAQIFSSCKNNKTLTIREEKIIFGTIGFMTRAKTLIHSLMQNLSEYNPHYVDYKLSTIRGSVLGCRKIHLFLSLNIDYCNFENFSGYMHPLLHCPEYQVDSVKAEKVENLQEALDNLRKSIKVVLNFLPSQSRE